MVRVRILEVIEHGFSTAFVRYEPGQFAEVPANLASRWLDAGQVELAPAPEPEPEPEPPVEEPQTDPEPKAAHSRAKGHRRAR